MFRWDAAPEPLGPPWPLVLASDVLYEERNVAPLLALLPRLVAAAGEVWLADPGRAPAAGFLTAAAESWRIDAIPHDGPAHVTVHRLRAAQRSRNALSRCERAGRLALGRARDEHAAGHAAEEAAGLRVLVEVVEARALAAVERRQPVDDARVGAGRPPALPDRVVRRVDLRQRPLHLEVGAVQAERLLDLGSPRAAAPSSTCPSLRWIVTQSSKWVGSMITLPDALGRAVDLDRGRDGAHRAASSSARSQSRSARSTAASKRVQADAEAPAAASSRGSRSCSSDSISGAISADVLAGDRGGHDATPPPSW